ncbi:MAG: heavy metal-associated domain-containing protein, partial [Desulfoprunum sp.]|nr:heavy metal-associated domain-containing protein [Desulfoprunum sp.]
MKLDNYTRIVNGSERSPCQDACCASADEEVKIANCDCDNAVAVKGIFPLSSIQMKQQEAVVQTGQAQSGMHVTVFRVSGMDCGDCAAKLEKRLVAMSGVGSATVNFGAGKLRVEHNVDDSLIIQAVKQAGYKADKEDKTIRQPLVKSIWWKNARTLTTIISGVVLIIAAILDWVG